MLKHVLCIICLEVDVCEKVVHAVPKLSLSLNKSFIKIEQLNLLFEFEARRLRGQAGRFYPRLLVDLKFLKMLDQHLTSCLPFSPLYRTS